MSSNTLDPEIAAILARLPTGPQGRLSVADQRARFAVFIDGFRKALQPLMPNESEYTVEDQVVPVEGGEIKVRSIVPKGGEELPLLVWYHGGGWALGDLDTDDYYLRIISVKLKVVTVSVEYRLAPEFPFPTGINDSFAGLKWAAENAGKLSASLSKGFLVGGTSAGGNISASVALLARDDPFFKNQPLTGQLLIIPSVIHVDANAEKYRSELLSMEENKDAPILGADAIRHFNEIYQAPPEDPRFSVLLAESHAGLPPAFIQVCASDPLRDEGIVYEKALRNAGVKTQIHVYPGMPHGAHMLVNTAKITAKFNNDTHDGIRWLLSL